MLYGSTDMGWLRKKAKKLYRSAKKVVSKVVKTVKKVVKSKAFKVLAAVALVYVGAVYLSGAVANTAPKWLSSAVAKIPGAAGSTAGAVGGVAGGAISAGGVPTIPGITVPFGGAVGSAGGAIAGAGAKSALGGVAGGIAKGARGLFGAVGKIGAGVANWAQNNPELAVAGASAIGAGLSAHSQIQDQDNRRSLYSGGHANARPIPKFTNTYQPKRPKLGMLDTAKFAPKVASAGSGV